MEKRVLGKGLNALIPARNVASEATAAIDASVEGNIFYIPVKDVKANKYQPRVEFNKEKLDELISSVKTKGVVQPILVRKTADGYELIAGERRLRAAKSAGLEKIPVILRDADDLSSLELSLIENIQREDLNPIEEANAYQRLMADFAYTQEKISSSLSKDRSTIANILRLLALPKKIQDYIAKNSITAGHGKAILALPSEEEQLRVSNLVIKKGLSVRETETLVSKRLGPQKRARAQGADQADLKALEEELRRIFGTRVQILHGKKRGKVQIEYYSKEDLNRIIDILISKGA